MTRNYVTVALTGDGGDEVFGGYNRYQMANYAHTYRSWIPQFLHRPIKKTVNYFETYDNRKSIINKSKRFLNALGENEQEDQLNIIKLGFNDDELKKLMLVNFEKNTYFNKKYEQTNNFSTLKKSRFLDKSISLEGDMLVKVDKASMLVSLECRAPFLDHRLWEFTNHLPDSFLIKNGNKKRILKDTFAHLLPSNFFNLPKSGFGVPVGEWLRTSLKSELIHVTTASFLKEQAIFNAPYITTLVHEHLNNTRDHTFKLWTLYCFQKWYKIANG
jgi:asparagine synthase (glutamine-hydrolysing)